MSLILPQAVKKVNELFVDTRYKHLFQIEDGTYRTSDINNNEERKAEGKRPFTYLADWKIQSHLEGKSTIGVFGQSMHSKFLTFDVDFKHDIQLGKWYALKTVYALMELGIKQDDIHVSFSGNKGYHVDLYFDKPIALDKLNRFFQLTMKDLGLERVFKDNRVYEFRNAEGAIEFRPIGIKVGVKLPLSIHKKTGKRCWYVDIYNRFTPYESVDYVLSIEQMDSDVIEMILEENEGALVEYVEVQETKSHIEENYKPLPIYKVGVSEEETIEAYEQLESEGLKYKGSRHNSSFKLARYYRYLGYTQEETVQALNSWISEQDTRMYDTPIQDCFADNVKIADYIFENQISIVQEKDYITVSYNEMVEILKAKKKNNKLTLFAMMIHSKRYADKQGVFYMSQNQLTYATGLKEDNSRANVDKLEEQGLISIVARNQKQQGTYMKKPNKYKLNIAMEGVQAVDVSVDGDLEEQFNSTLVSLIPLDELKKALPRRHYEEMRELYKNA